MQTEPACAMERVHYTDFLSGSFHTLLDRIIVTERTFVAAPQHRKAVLGIWRQWPSFFYCFSFSFSFFLLQLPNLQTINFMVVIKYMV